MFSMPHGRQVLNDHVIEVDPCSDPRWDRLVAIHPFGWLYHTSHWKTILEQSFHHIHGHYFAIEDPTTGDLHAALPLCSVSSWLLGNRLVALPFASLFDPMVERVQEFQILFDEVLARVYDSGAFNYLEVRALKSAALIRDHRLHRSQTHLHHYIMLDRSLGELQKAFHRSCVSQRIKKAEKCGLEVREGKSENDLKSFYRLYVGTRKRLLLPPQPYRFLQIIWKQLQPRGYVDLLMVVHEGEDLGGILVFKYKNRASIEYAAYDHERIYLSPVHLLFWEAIRRAWIEGFSILDFGQTAIDNRSLAVFKRRWGAREIPITTFHMRTVGIRTVREYCLCFNRIGLVCQHLPEWLFLLISRFCYRHLG